MNTVTTQGSLTLRNAVGSDNIQIRQLLEKVKLPAESLDNGATTFYVAEENGTFVGIAGFEFYGDDALLRSVAIPPELQNRGIGDRIVNSMISIAQERNLKRIILLTETAERFFQKKGFRVIDRSSIDNDAMNHSSEFTFACPSTAVCMVLELKLPRT
jgi:amino-acid N-acetyltransferase